MVTLKAGKLEAFEIEDLTGACDEPVKEELLAGFTYSFIKRDKAVYNCPRTDCTSAVNVTGACDPKIFISWIGTDRDGNTLISASNKLSNFEQYNMKGMFASIMKVNTNNHSDPDKPVRYDSSQVDKEVAKRLTDPTLASKDDNTSAPTTTDGSNTDTSGTTPTDTSGNSGIVAPEVAESEPYNKEAIEASVERKL